MRCGRDRITVVKFMDGERYPVLLDTKGQPHWYPTLFLTTQFRNATKALNTCLAALRTVRFVLEWASASGLDLEARFRQHRFLTPSETELLADYLASPSDLSQRIPMKFGPGLTRNVERVRAKPQEREDGVSAIEFYNRITYAAAYLRWLGNHVVAGAAYGTEKADRDIQCMYESLRSRRPKGRRQTHTRKRAQSSEEEQAFLALFTPGSAQNPFTDAVQSRNQLIAELLNDLGLRSGELLGLWVEDIDFQAQELVVRRRINKPKERRAQEPQAKTGDRRIALDEHLVELLFKYITKHRNTLPRARRHPNLLVAFRSSRRGKAGDRLSQSALQKVIAIAASKMPPGSVAVHPHLLRHNSATKTAKGMACENVPEAKADQILSWKFGWLEGSGSAAHYTQLFRQQQALEVQRKLQRAWRRK